MVGSLENVVSHWLSEVKSYCSNVPILLVGLQGDRRHNDVSKYAGCDRKIPSLTKYLRSQTGNPNSTHRQSMRDSYTTTVTVEPELCRKIATDIGALLYFETSVSTRFGLEDLFSAAARLGEMRKLKEFEALRRRFEVCLWKDLLQAPHLHEKAKPPLIKVDTVTDVFFRSLYKEVQSSTPSSMTDVEFVFEDQSVFAHRLVLTMFVPSLKVLFEKVIALSQRDSKTCSNLPKAYQNYKVSDLLKPRFQFIMAGEAATFLDLLAFYYTGSMTSDVTKEMLKMAKDCCFHQVVLLLTESLHHELLHATIDVVSLHARNTAREFLENEFLSDLTLVVGEDCVEIPAHKLILSRRSKVFSAMLENGEFSEKLYSKVLRMIARKKYLPA